MVKPMAEENTQETEKRTGEDVVSPPQPFLTRDIFLELLELPMCKTTGGCNGCGQCGP